MAKFLITMSTDSAILIVQGLQLLTIKLSDEMHNEHVILSESTESDYLEKLDHIDDLITKLTKFFDL